MIRAQMKLLFKRKEFQVTFAGMMLLIAYVFLSQCYTAFGTDATYYLSADKLFIGRANAHDINIILPFLLPLVCVLPFADSYVTDKQQYCLPSLLSRSTPKKYYWAKLKMVAFSAAFVIFIPFFIHFILSLIAFPLHSTNYSWNALSTDQSPYYGSYMEGALFPYLFVHCPYLYNFLFLCLLTLFCALTAVLVFQVSFFISKNRILVLAFAFLLNNLIYILAGLFSDLDIRPYAYLFSLDTSPTKRLWFLMLLFAARSRLSYAGMYPKTTRNRGAVICVICESTANGCFLWYRSRQSAGCL